LNRLVDQVTRSGDRAHLDVIKTADWIISAPKRVTAACRRGGTPEQISRGRGGRGRWKSPGSFARLRLRRLHTAYSHPRAAAGRVERAYNPAAIEAPRGRPRNQDAGRDTQMPWEVDGRRWHTQDRVARDGQPCKWDGRILGKIEEQIHELGTFSPTNWNSRTIVEITAAKKSDGWFFHAITGERWLLKLKFRTGKKTFEREKLVADLGLKPLNDIDDIEAYGRGPRVKCKNLRGHGRKCNDVHCGRD
jgi:excinuclease ABC subunit A